ncbi:MAG: SMC-Scp complex subunit ScpB [Lachnospiraceae bacterium]|nr:SMC-Scp complex subunit ScpB [Candidatus Darwinimomas equi]
MTYEQELRQEAIVESVLFTMGKSVETRQLAAALDCDEYAARSAAQRLQKKYDDEQRGMQILELENSWQMCSRAEFYDNLIKVAKTPKKQVLTEAVLETLSVVAYKQPVTRTEMDNIRGVSCEYALNKLLEYGLVYEAGRLDAPGKPALFATTEEFLRRFGVGSRKALPSMNSDKEAEIVEEVEKEVGFRFGTEPIPVQERLHLETADSIVEAVAQEMANN